MHLINELSSPRIECTEDRNTKISEKLVLDTAAETVRRFKQVWSDQKETLPLDKKVVGIVDAHAASIPIYTEL